MNIDGYNLMLQEFCAYCKYFEPEVEKIEYPTTGRRIKFFNKIKCVHMDKCADLAIRIGNR